MAAVENDIYTKTFGIKSITICIKMTTVDNGIYAKVFLIKIDNFNNSRTPDFFFNAEQQNLMLIPENQTL